jgi:hypothetical protein
MLVILLVVFSVATVLGRPALACAPAPSCWLKGDPAYLRSLCSTYANYHQTLKQIAQYLDEPEKIGDFGAACRKLHVDLKAE